MGRGITSFYAPRLEYLILGLSAPERTVIVAEKAAFASALLEELRDKLAFWDTLQYIRDEI